MKKPVENFYKASDADDILSGLKQRQKRIASRFLYDAKGSRLFQQIMKMPEYYLYDAELEVLKRFSPDIQKALPFQERYSFVEFGAGDGSKVVHLLQAVSSDPLFLKYKPVDISSEANHLLVNELKKQMPEIGVHPVTGNYFDEMKSLIPGGEATLLLFLGSNIGNFSAEKTQALMDEFYESLKPGDGILIGFDLRKHPGVIRQAYDDPEGITKAFNMNLLTRMNREYEADFDPGRFDFYSYYHPDSGEVRSYLVSLITQNVRFKTLDETIHFDRNELTHTEISKKFSMEEIKALLSHSGFTYVDSWMDSRSYFADVLAIKEAGRSM